MQNTPRELSYLKAPLDNGLQVLVQCEKIRILRKCFLRGVVEKTKYKVTIVEPEGLPWEALYSCETYVAKWWWRLFSECEAQAATTIHLLVLKTRFERFKLKTRIHHSLT